MTKVFRVEHPSSGRGPYRHTNGVPMIPAMHDAHNDSKKHPGPWTDLGIIMDKDYLCGFSSPWKLLKWFKGWIGALNSRGFKIAVYDSRVIDTSKRTGQTVFVKLLREKPIYYDLPKNFS